MTEQDIKNYAKKKVANFYNGLEVEIDNFIKCVEEFCRIPGTPELWDLLYKISDTYENRMEIENDNWLKYHKEK